MGICRAWVIVFGLAGPAAAACSEATLELRTDAGIKARFAVEVADSSAERATGLMHRENMPMAAGMLFVYPAAGPVSFWMENTLIPLDMVFADSTGTVRHVHANAVPGDRTPIFGGDGIQYVLEINGGLAKRMQIEPGTVLRHPAIDQAVAAFPCTGE